MSRQAQKTVNPFTKEVSTVSHREVSSLQQYSKQALRRALGINRVHEVNSLNLKEELQDCVKTFNLTDFIVPPGQVKDDNYTNHTFPALCVFDKNPVVLRILNSREELDNFPFLLTSFDQDDCIVGIYDDKETLAEIIKQTRDSGVGFPESIIWRYISQICEEIMTLGDSVKIEPRGLCFYRGKVLHTGLVTRSSMTELKELSELDLYVAPEVLMHTPYSRAAQAWAVGCIAYELAALKPAFSTVGTDDSAMEVMLEVMQLSQSPELPEDLDHGLEYSPELQDLIDRTLTKDPEDRLELEEIQSLALFNMNIL